MLTLHRVLNVLILMLSFLLIVPQAMAEGEGDNPSFADQVATYAFQPGFMDTYVDADAAQVLVALPAADEDGLMLEAIYAEYLAAGLGSNPVGLDRAQQGLNLYVQFRRIGNTVYLVAPNTQYVAETDNALEIEAVKDSFAPSMLWSGPVVATADDGRVLVNISSFLVRDAHGVAARLAGSGQGNFSLNKDLSTVDPNAIWAFPMNTEYQAITTFTGSGAGGEVRGIVPEESSITLRLHHTFVALPEPGYVPREGDPRSGALTIPVYDYAAPLDQPIIKQYILRHRLEKTDPNAARSTVKEPIVYYVDPGAPDDIKQALIEGGNWWADAFDAAGFIDAYRVEELPEGAHPLDIRYNMINWVHRQTRGWSYGGSVYDPRTGEILKGNVLLGSLRVRQDRMIFEGLVGRQMTGTGGPNDPTVAALARIRQLSAHEIGHTIGFNHNMAASINDRASVMDYPAPRIKIADDGTLDLSEAYAVGIGDWDKATVAYAYSQFPDGVDETAALDAILDDANAQGLLYVSDGHSRPLGAGNPWGNLWDTGSDPIAELTRMLEVRRIALDGFGTRSQIPHEPREILAQRFVPIYLLHRYQIQAAAKSVGGYDYQYSVASDDRMAGTPVAADRQRDALSALLAAVQPAVLDVRDDVLNLMIDGPDGFDAQAGREVFRSPTRPAFSLLDAADVAARQVFTALLHPQRISRVAELSVRYDDLPNIRDILEATNQSVFAAPRGESARHRALRDVVKARYVSTLIELTAGVPADGANIPGFSQNRGNETLSALAEAEIRVVLRDLAGTLSGRRASAFDRMLADRITAHLDRPAGAVQPFVGGIATPPGSPIGATTDEACWMCDLSDGF